MAPMPLPHRTPCTHTPTRPEPRPWLMALCLAGMLASSPRLGHAQEAAPLDPAPSATTFESGPVRPLALSADGSRLFVANTPNHTLDVFSVTDGGLSLQARVPVGLEPVAVALRNDKEVWVVNHLSDSVSVVSLAGTPHVARTLLVGDEPRDIVFAGTPAKAFITTAHRGQHRTDASLLGKVPGAGDPQFTTPSIGRADVWVFNPGNLGDTVGGTPLRIMSFFADTPRALAVSPDRNTVYVAAFKSGNQTTVIGEDLVCNGFDKARPCKMKGFAYPGGVPGPSANAEGKAAPEVGLIVKYDPADRKWKDVMGRDWTSGVRFNLPDKDVFAIDAFSLTDKAIYTGVGTTLFNMATNPKTGVLYVSNTEALNMGRFEGEGQHGGTTLQGRLAQTRITVINQDKVQPRHLNKHIDYSKLASAADFDKTTPQHSLSTPLEMAVSGDGQTLFVAAFGSSRIGVIGTRELEDDTFKPQEASARYISLSGGGPSGIVLDEKRNRMYVSTRFDNAVKVINLATRTEVSAVSLPNPEPEAIVKGRPFLYDAQRSSANGEASCASCHIFGDMDDLAWDLGNPDDKVSKSPLKGNFTNKTFMQAAMLIFGIKGKMNGSGNPDEFHPMKGPMTTQTLRGMRNAGAMHWRGDRSNGVFGIDATDTTLSFKNFAPAFRDLLGRAEPLSEADMNAFTAFQLSVLPPPNPVRALDNQLTAAQQRGKDFFFGKRPADGVILPSFLGFLNNNQPTNFNCAGCHETNAAKGQFGAGGLNSFDGALQLLKVPHLRNQYAKIGMFGAPPSEAFMMPDTGHVVDQIRGFGFTHEGSVNGVFHFLTARVLRTMGGTGFPKGEEGNQVRRDSEQYVLAFENDVAPIVGQQVTLTGSNAATAGPRIDLMMARAKAPFVSKELGGSVTECDLVVHGVQDAKVMAYLFNTSSMKFADAQGQELADEDLRALATRPGQALTYTCALPGTGRRMAFQR